MKEFIAPSLHHELFFVRNSSFFQICAYSRSARHARKKARALHLDQALYFHRLIILQRYVKPPHPLLFVHPRRRSLAIGQVCSSPHAPKGRWGLRAFKRRASAHSSFCVARGHFASRDSACISDERVCISSCVIAVHLLGSCASD